MMPPANAARPRAAILAGYGRPQLRFFDTICHKAALRWYQPFPVGCGYDEEIPVSQTLGTQSSHPNPADAKPEGKAFWVRGLCPVCGAQISSESAACPSCGEQRLHDVWRDGTLMVMRRDFRLPPICLVSGERTERRETMVFRWRNRKLIYVLVFLVCVPYSVLIGLPLLIGNPMRTL